MAPFRHIAALLTCMTLASAPLCKAESHAHAPYPQAEEANGGDTIPSSSEGKASLLNGTTTPSPESNDYRLKATTTPASESKTSLLEAAAPLYPESEDSITEDSTAQAGTTKARKKGLFPLIGRALGHVTDFFMGCDTNYVTPQLYQFTGQIELSMWHDFYHMSANNKNMTIVSDPSMVLGAYIYWGMFGYGHSINLQDIGKPSGKTNGTGQRNVFSLNTARFIAEIYTFNSGKTAKIKSVSDYKPSGEEKRFTGLSSKSLGINAEYVFNHKRYSWPAAFGENAVQRKSCGSWKLGLAYNHQKISMDKDALPDYLLERIDTTLFFKNIDYTDYSISFGYGYNWAFRKNCLLAVSLLPSIGYRKSNILDGEMEKFSLDNISTDLITRASLFWNNTKYFAGFIAELHTYSYREKKFGLTNTYGTFKFVFGLNFLKKPKPTQ